MTAMTSIPKAAGLVLLLGLLLAPTPARAAIPCTAGPTFNLQTAAGYASTPDGNSVYMWSYTVAGGGFQLPSPILCVTEGDTVTINLTNTLPNPPGPAGPDNTSIVFPGQSGVTATGGVAGLFTSEAAPAGSVTYSFVAGAPGTYLYESGTLPHKQVAMGLYGALIVRPASCPGLNPCAYGTADSEYHPDREYLLLLHDIDHRLHRAVERGRPYDITKRHDTYWTINGRSFPDTINADGISWLPGQPYGALVTIQPYDALLNPLPALIRYANAGWNNHPFHPHGNNMRIIARDGRRLAAPGGSSTALESFTTVVGSGQTYDILAWWYDLEHWSSASNKIPVELPGPQLTTYKDHLTWYSGSPYLGEKGILPRSVTSLNQCGEFYFAWHSHALNEFQNWDEGFGGLATMWRVDPLGGCIP
jgi:FtsP/CotA-like multicopper oxidase with cupredoxin domain